MSRDHDSLNTTSVADAPARPSARNRAILTVTSGADAGRVIPVGPGEMVTLGRSDECSVKLADNTLSRVHARVGRVREDYILKDMGSTNGSFVNSERVEFAVQLKDGDRIRLGTQTTIRFSLIDELEEQALNQRPLHGDREKLLAAFQELEAREGNIKDDMLQAQEFQRRALPAPPQIAGLDVEIVYRPLDLVGGDLYHVTRLGELGVRVFIADATGHGVKASLTTMLILSEYELVKERTSPAEVRRDLSDRIATTYAHLGVHFTAACLDVDLDRGVLVHAAAAHPAAYLSRGAELTELETGGPLMGLVAGVEIPEWRVALRRGDGVLVFTDGATEAWSASGEPFGDGRLRDAAREAGAKRAPMGAAIHGALETFVGPGRPLDDDLTLIAVRWLER